MTCHAHLRGIGRHAGLLASIVSVALSAACGITARDGQFRCPDGRCPSGLVCNMADGLCHVPGAVVDGGPLDAPRMDSATDDAPMLDAPVDGAPDAPDAPILDTPPPVDAGPPESCEPAAATGAPADEDLDGRIDEGCTLAFGPIHPVLPAMPRIADYFGLELIGDGLSGVVVDDGTVTNRPVLVVRRPSFALPFAPAVPLTGTASGALAPMAVTVTAAGNEIVVQARETGFDVHLYSALGSVSGGSFAALTRLTELDGFGAAQIHPSLTRDGLELFFVAVAFDSSTNVMHARRSAVGAAWSSPTSLGSGVFARPSEDGLTLYYFDPAALVGRTLVRSARSDPFGATSTGATWSPLGGTRHMLLPSFHARTREVFFTYATDTPGGARPSDAPLRYSIFRAEVCANGPCVPTMIPCTPPEGVRSADGLHCYRLLASPGRTFAEMQTMCVPLGHLATIHSLDEDAIVYGRRASSWLASTGTTWLTGEPWLFERWSTAPATAGQCTYTHSSGWTAGNCTPMTAPGVCEDEIWPAFVAP